MREPEPARFCWWVASNGSLSEGEKLLTLKQRLQLAMAQRRQEERARRAELHRLDNEDCEEEEEEEEDMTDESEEEVKTWRFCRGSAPPSEPLTVVWVSGSG